MGDGVGIKGVSARHRRILALDQRQQSSQTEQVEQVPLAILHVAVCVSELRRWVERCDVIHDRPLPLLAFIRP